MDSLAVEIIQQMLPVVYNAGDYASAEQFQQHAMVKQALKIKYQFHNFAQVVNAIR